MRKPQLFFSLGIYNLKISDSRHHNENETGDFTIDWKCRPCHLVFDPWMLNYWSVFTDEKWSVLNLKERKTLNRSDSKSWIQSQGFMFTPTFLNTTWIQIKSWFHSTHSLTKYTFTFFKPIIIHHFSNNFQTIKSWKEVKDENKAVLPSPNSFVSLNPNLELFSRFFYLKI